MVIVRFLLRFLLIPLGVVVGSLAAMLLLAAVSGGKVLALLTADPNATADAVETIVFAGAAMVLALASTSTAIMLPALIAIAIAEIVAIRSWLYYPAAGAASAWIGWWTMRGVHTDYAILNEPTLMAAAGIAGGLGYWLVAGWNAGFWKPVFAGRAPLSVPQPPIR